MKTSSVVIIAVVIMSMLRIAEAGESCYEKIETTVENLAKALRNTVEQCKKDDCSTNSHNCDCNAVCKTTYTCSCKNGYSGDGKTCIDMDECSMKSHSCDVNAVCTNTPGSYTCQCKAGYSGDGKTCIGIDKCSMKSHSCDVNAVCANTNGSYTCSCKDGYSGDGRTCIDIDECSIKKHSCDVNAVCTNTPGSYTCQCKAGYSGDGKTCTDIDECSTNSHSCDVKAVCTNTPGSYTCGCKAGYSGDGKTCTDIDECSIKKHSCDVNAVCTNIPGSYTCGCKAGYSGDGKTCTDIDECSTNSHGCDVNAVCTNTPGSYTCGCKAGYSGDGKTCTVVPASSCKELYEKHNSKTSKVYTLKFGSQEIPVYCHMGNLGGCGGGGWTLAMKIDGHKRTFHYDSFRWSDKTPFNTAGGQTGFDTQETKLPIYWNTPFSKICLGMMGRFVVIHYSANSLYSLIADGHYRRTSLGRYGWKNLIGSQASLQRNCNREGFNVIGDRFHSRARIGIIANQENDCNSCDSRIGFGTGGHGDDSNTCGNEATIETDNGDRHIKTMGYILVQ